MPANAIQRVTVGQNGVGAFVLQCKRLEFFYCDWAGSSRGMNSFILHTLPKVAASNPQIEIAVSPRPRKHPVIKATYINTRKEKAICVKNLQKEQILHKVILLRDASGAKVQREVKPVKSIKESVRGIWSPYHGGGMSV